MEAAAPTLTLDQRLADITGALNVLHGELVTVVAEIKERSLWAAYGGIRSLSQFLCWQLGCSPSSAHDLIRLADALATHPETTQLLVDGVITLDQSAAAVKARPSCDTVMSHLAPLSTVAQIRLEVRAANANVTPPETPELDDEESEPPSDVRPGESLSFGRADDGQWWLTGRLDPERGEIVDQALREARDRLFRGGRTDVTWADALIDIAQRSLGECTGERGRRYRANVFVDTDDQGRLTGHLTDGTRLPDAVLAHLTCDADLSAILCRNGSPVNVGYSQRTVPEPTRRVVLHRDGGRCQNPACNSRYGLEVHHIIHWTKNGPTVTFNLITLCSGCHHLHHQGRLGITGNADLPNGITFTDGRGNPLVRPKPNPPAVLPTPPAVPYKHPLGQRLDADNLAFIFPEPQHPN